MISIFFSVAGASVHLQRHHSYGCDPCPLQGFEQVYKNALTTLPMGGGKASLLLPVLTGLPLSRQPPVVLWGVEHVGHTACRAPPACLPAATTPLLIPQ